MARIVEGHNPLFPGIYVGRQARGIEVGQFGERNVSEVLRLGAALRWAAKSPTPTEITPSILAAPKPALPPTEQAVARTMYDNLADVNDLNPGVFTLINPHPRPQPEAMPVRGPAELLYKAVDETNGVFAVEQPAMPAQAQSLGHVALHSVPTGPDALGDRRAA